MVKVVEKTAKNKVAGRRGKMTRSPEHIAAMAAGRARRKAVEEYLEALQVSAEQIGEELAELDAIAINGDSPVLERLTAISRKIEIEQERNGLDAKEKAFTEHAKEFGAREGVSKGAWLKMGVPARVLSRAGIR